MDDGSTDASGAICDEYAKRDERVRVIHQQNGGVASARNAGLASARGDYIAWCDPDDYVASDWFDALRPLLAQGYDLLYFDYYRHENGISEAHAYGGLSRLLDKTVYLQELCEDVKVLSYLFTRVYKKELWRDINFPSGVKLMEDFAVMHKLVYNARNIYYLARPLYYYCINADSICRTVDAASRYKATLIAEERYDWLKKRGVTVGKRGYWWHNLNFCHWFCRENSDESARGYYQKARRVILHDMGAILMDGKISARDKAKYFLLAVNLYPIALTMIDKLKNIANTFRSGGVKPNFHVWRFSGGAGVAPCC